MRCLCRHYFSSTTLQLCIFLTAAAPLNYFTGINDLGWIGPYPPINDYANDGLSRQKAPLKTPPGVPEAQWSFRDQLQLKS